jgi:tripartite-type tricarboxylate transporter receptor subunit TctC
MKKSLRSVLALAACAVAAFTGPAAHAQAFPSKPIHLIIPAAPGGPTDTLGRLVGKIMSEQNGVPVVVENKAGAAGSIGVYATVQAPTDGYTLLVSTPDAVTVYPLVKKNAPYSTRDLKPITLIASTPYVFGVNAQSPAKTMKEFVALSKSRKLAMSTSGSGASAHIVLELLKQQAGMDLLHVPYKGAGPALQAIIAGETHITATSPVTLKAHIDSGKLRALAVSGAQRNPVLPDVPTMEESGFPEFVVTAWFAILAPAGVPDAVADKLNEMVLAAMKSPDYLARIKALGLDPEPVSRARFGQLLAGESARWKKLIDSAGIKADE